eukprot:TRINITY_DN2463_c0_g1_i1.p1 TRINITY_DN2463_c0_g1~~TRINITY_DN2463_c0_g1_i1.p1  ORF type:complete len:223 (-),score=49.95 TRINITY_DN2463_c0_g1_i1:213-881(-)
MQGTTVAALAGGVLLRWLCVRSTSCSDGDYPVLLACHLRRVCRAWYALTREALPAALSSALAVVTQGLRVQHETQEFVAGGVHCRLLSAQVLVQASPEKAEALRGSVVAAPESSSHCTHSGTETKRETQHVVREPACSTFLSFLDHVRCEAEQRDAFVATCLLLAVVHTSLWAVVNSSTSTDPEQPMTATKVTHKFHFTLDHPKLPPLCIVKFCSQDTRFNC